MASDRRSDAAKSLETGFIYSEEAGETFNIYSPLTISRASTCAVTNGASELTSLSDIHVLVVDDNTQMRLLVRCLLRAGGITKVTEAKTGRQALDIMRPGTIDLIIVDWKMAPLDGLAFTNMVRRSPESPNPFVPILMLTAHTEASRVTAARDAGVSGFIKKPISARLLFERISNVLTDTRSFVRCETFVGPDRRRSQAADYAGPFRRESDRPDSTLDIDDLRWSA
jgi:two-component system, chemotaxis family, chemotaxis protein CheY